jgi:2-hydroxychromene-2-carboxylate isomerase
MEWEDILKFLVTSGILATIVGALVKLATKWIGDKLGLDESKRKKAADLLSEVAEKAMRAAEQSAKHKKFARAEDQALWKETFAVDMIMRLTGTDNHLAKSALRAVFNVSDLNNKPKMSHEDVHKFEDAEVNKIVERMLGENQ